MKRLLPALFLLLPASTGLLHAQTAATNEPAALTAARAAFLRQVMTDSQLLTEQYERALAKAEVEVAAAGDYEEARAIWQRREQLRSLYSGTVTSLATPLPLAQARMTGSAQYSGETLSGWRSSGSGAEWQNFRLAPGRYQLEFEASMSDAPVAGNISASSKFQPQTSATFEFHEVTLLSTAGDNRRTFEIAHSDDETTFTPVRAGPYTFTRSPLTLRFAASTGYPANVIRVRNLRLAPYSEDASTATDPALPSTTQLQQASTSFKATLEDVKKTTSDAYLAELKQLATTKPQLKDQIDVETRRVEKRRDPKPGLSGLRAIASSANENLDGFEDISDARLADAEPAAGDRFKIIHEGQTLDVRLLWVECAPLTESDPGVKRFAKHFHIENDDAVSIGRVSREFTAGYLRDKPLRLLIRPDRDKDGTVAALLFVPDVGLYQSVLVDHGLAAVAPPARDEKRTSTEKALIEALSKDEDRARKRQKPPGAWALTTETEGGKKQ